MQIQVTLRQAHKLNDKINARLATIDLTPTKRVNIWNVSDAAATLTALRDGFIADLERHLALVEARAAVRALIGRANSQKIDEIVVARKLALDTVATYRTIVAAVNDNSTISTTDAFTNKVEAVRAASKTGSSSYFSDDLSVLTVDGDWLKTVDETIQQGQNVIEGLEDQLTQLNAATLIVVPDSVVSTLKKEGLIS